MKSDISGLLVGDRNEWKDMTTLKGRFESIESNIEDIKKEQVNIQKTLTTKFQSSKAELLYNQNLLQANLHQIEELKNITSETLGVGRNNSWKLDGLKVSSELINGNVLDNSNKMDKIEKIGKTTEEEVMTILRKIDKEKCPDMESKVWQTGGIFYHK